MVGVAKKLMDKAGKEGKLWISGLYEYRVTPQSGSIASPLQLITAHTQGERSTSTIEYPRSPGDVSNLTRTHQEAAEQAGEELH